MAETSGIEAAIRELTQEQQKIEQVIKLLQRIHPPKAFTGNTTGNHRTGRLSAKARKRISEAAKKRWATVKSKRRSSRGKR